MSVLVKGMKMPAVCADCDFCIETKDDHKCSRTKESLGLFAFEMTRGMKCPLGYIPKSMGDLIDRAVLIDSFEPSDFWNSSAEDNCFAAIHATNSMPTIIPAEEGGED